MRIVSFTVQLSVKKQTKKPVLTKVSGLSLLTSVVTLSSVSALTVLQFFYNKDLCPGCVFEIRGEEAQIEHALHLHLCQSGCCHWV